MQEDKKQYLLLMSEIVAKAIMIFGVEMAVLKAQSISELSVNRSGGVTAINGYSADALQKLVNGYLELSNQSARNIFDQIFAKYPTIKKI